MVTLSGDGSGLKPMVSQLPPGSASCPGVAYHTQETNSGEIAEIRILIRRMVLAPEKLHFPKKSWGHWLTFLCSVIGTTIAKKQRWSSRKEKD